jgi:hypothetical protein
MCNHVGRLVVRRCGAKRWWSMVKVKVMGVHPDGPGAMKDERCDLTEGPESPGDQSWWLKLGTH